MAAADAQIQKTGTGKPKKSAFVKKMGMQKSLLFMSLPVVVYVFIFSYRPLKGLVMAFQNFKPGKKVQQWVGLKHFVRLFSDEAFLRILRNTICMSLITLVLSFTCAILLAILINEVRSRHYKRVVQSVSYMPHFLSWIIVTGIVANFLSSDNGVINMALMKLGIIKENILWLGKPNYFWGIVGGANVWKETGWNSIIYLAAISSISPDLYEAANIDGANRFHKILHITLPGIRPTIVVLLILSMGWILNGGGFEVQYLLGNNGIVSDVSKTIDIFVLVNGVRLNDYSLATAAGLFKSAVSLVILTSVNSLANRLGEEKLV
jgi:putative aldouronate transport system permease protein